MVIVLLTDTFTPDINGVSTSVTTLYNVLKSNGHDVYVVATNPYSNKLTYEDKILRIPGFKVKKLYSYIIGNYFNNKIYKILKEIKPDIVHVHTEFSVFMIAEKMHKYWKCPYIYTYHTNYEDYTYYITGNHFINFGKWAVKDWILNNTDQFNEIIAPSSKTKEYLESVGVKPHINIVPTGINLSNFKNFKFDENKRKEYLKELGVPENNKVLLYLGRIAQEKNIKELQGFFKKILEKRSDVSLLIVGEGPYKNEIIEYGKKLGIDDKTFYIGQVPYNQIAFYYSLGDVFINSSLSETQGLTYIEAMASKRVLLVRYDKNLENLIVDGKNGFFFTNENEFLEKIGKIFEKYPTLYSEIGKNMEKTLEWFSLENFYDRIMEVYERAKSKS